MGLVCVRLLPFLGDEQELVEEEESSLILGPLQAERSFKNQLSIANEIRALPVSQKALDFLQEEFNCGDLKLNFSLYFS